MAAATIWLLASQKDWFSFPTLLKLMFYPDALFTSGVPIGVPFKKMVYNSHRSTFYIGLKS